MFILTHHFFAGGKILFVTRLDCWKEEAHSFACGSVATNVLHDNKTKKGKKKI